MQLPRGITMRLFMLATAAAALCACATASEPAQRSAKAQAEYDRLLAGKVPGKVEKCLPTYQSNDMTVIEERAAHCEEAERWELLVRDAATDG